MQSKLWLVLQQPCHLKNHSNSPVLWQWTIHTIRLSAGSIELKAYLLCLSRFAKPWLQAHMVSSCLPLTNTKMLDLLSNFGDCATGFMSKNDRCLELNTKLATMNPGVYIATTETHWRYAQLHLWGRTKQQLLQASVIWPRSLQPSVSCTARCFDLICYSTEV